MRRPSQTDSHLQKLERQMQQLVAPYLTHPHILHRSNQKAENGPWSPADHLEYVFHVNLELLVNLHALPDAGTNPERRPTLQGWWVLLTGWFTRGIDRRMAEYQPGRIDRDRDISWLREHFTHWNNQLAGLHFLPEGWSSKVVDQRHPALGYLTGADWLRIMYLFTRYHRKQLE